MERHDKTGIRNELLAGSQFLHKNAGGKTKKKALISAASEEEWTQRVFLFFFPKINYIVYSNPFEGFTLHQRSVRLDLPRENKWHREICLVLLSAATTNMSSLQIPAASLPRTPTQPKCYDRGRNNALTSGYYHTFTPEIVPLVSQILPKKIVTPHIYGNKHNAVLSHNMTQCYTDQLVEL